MAHYENIKIFFAVTPLWLVELVFFSLKLGLVNFSISPEVKGAMPGNSINRYILMKELVGVCNIHITDGTISAFNR